MPLPQTLRKQKGGDVPADFIKSIISLIIPQLFPVNWHDLNLAQTLGQWNVGSWHLSQWLSSRLGRRDASHLLEKMCKEATSKPDSLSPPDRLVPLEGPEPTVLFLSAHTCWVFMGGLVCAWQE